MRAAPGRAASALRVIARIWKRVDVTFALVLVRKVAEQGEFRVNHSLWTEVLLTEKTFASQDRIAGNPHETGPLTFLRRVGAYLATTAVTSISSSMPWMASPLMTRNVFAGIGPSP